MMQPLNFPEWFNKLIEKLGQRSTWDGSVIIGISVLALLASPFVKYVAMAGIVYGCWRVYEQEQNKS